MRKHWILILILAVYIVLIQFVMIALNATYDWKIIGIGVVVVALVGLTLGIANYRRYGRCVRAFNAKNWDQVIHMRKFLCTWTINRKLRDYSSFMLAVAYFEKGADADFRRHIGQIQDAGVVNRKYYWLAVDALLGRRTDEFAHWFAMLEKSESDVEKARYIVLLNLIHRAFDDRASLTSEEQGELETLMSDRIKQSIDIR